MYLHRPRLLRALQEGLPEGVLVHAPAGFGKTLLLKSFAEAKGLPYRRDWSPEPGCYDLRKPPPEVLPGQVVAARQARLPALHRLGPEDLAFTPEEVGELARRLGKRELAGPVHALFGGWPHLTRKALERGEAAWTPELRAFLEGLLPPLDLRPFLLPLPEAAFRQAGFGEAVEALLAQALAQGVPLRSSPPSPPTSRPPTPYRPRRRPGGSSRPPSPSGPGKRPWRPPGATGAGSSSGPWSGREGPSWKGAKWRPSSATPSGWRTPPPASASSSPWGTGCGGSWTGASPSWRAFPRRTPPSSPRPSSPRAPSWA
ncbi:ATP-binding protein [Thermus thermophilus]|uniref:Uncharacterized protein n=1 Tax=Thermus thermophilus (strain ATCC BAA-163 / DSM 7039 / HB27) TaxID=262724 RepID=Q72HJ2_THET2|nr:hypothetical protein TT_C1495 [Thermus thermophilus HB27]